VSVSLFRVVARDSSGAERVLRNPVRHVGVMLGVHPAITSAESAHIQKAPVGGEYSDVYDWSEQNWRSTQLRCMNE